MSTILITGASSGLGAEMARQFAARGHDLALCARRTDKLEALREEILAADPGRRSSSARSTSPTTTRSSRSSAPSAPTSARSTGIVVTRASARAPPSAPARYAANRETAMTNFLGALAQCEAAMEIFRAQEPATW